MNNERFLKDSTFFAEEVTFDVPGKRVSQNEIDEIDDFPGREEFIRFYKAHNGGFFVYGAWFFPEDCYHVSVGSNPHISMERFLGIPVDDEEEINIEIWRDVIEREYKNYEDFILFHIPFALDVVQNTFWIDIQTGEIKYTDDEVCSNPEEEAVIVASSFKNFCKRIGKNQLTDLY